MAVYEVSEKDLARKFREIEQRRPAVLVTAIRRAAAAGAEALASVAPVGVTGQFKARWRFVEQPAGAYIVNDSPYAGILELGARPHRPPVGPLIEWFRLKLGLSAAEAARAGYALAAKIAREGQRPTYFVRKRLPVLRRILGAEIERALKEAADGAG